MSRLDFHPIMPHDVCKLDHSVTKAALYYRECVRSTRSRRPKGQCAVIGPQSPLLEISILTATPAIKRTRNIGTRTMETEMKILWLQENLNSVDVVRKIHKRFTVLQGDNPLQNSSPPPKNEPFLHNLEALDERFVLHDNRRGCLSNPDNPHKQSSSEIDDYDLDSLSQPCLP